MFKAQVEPPVTGRRVVSLQSFEHFMASFLWFIRVVVDLLNIPQNSTGAFYALVKAY